MFSIAHKPPRTLPFPKPTRPLERRAVTIVAGFKCKDGVVLCADTQETIEHTKITAPKLRFEPRDMDSYDGPSELMAVFAGAGEGPFVDKLVERTWEDMQVASTFDEACYEAEKSIKLTYKEYGQIFQTGYCPSVELIYGIKMDGQSKLFLANGAVVNEKLGFANGGIGLYLSNFLSTVNLDLSEEGYKGLVEHLHILLALARERHRAQAWRLAENKEVKIKS